MLASLIALAGAAVDVYAPPAELMSCTNLVWRAERFARVKDGAAVVSIPKGNERATGYVRAPIDLTPFAGKGVAAEIRVSGANVTKPLHGYNGVKFQISYVDPKTGNRIYRDVQERPVGTFTNLTLHVDFALEDAVPKDAQLKLGLAESSGTVKFDLSSMRLGASEGLFRKVNADYHVRYPESIRARRRRGVMSPSRDMTEDDFRTLKDWGVNLLRFQMVRAWSKYNDNQDLAEYDRWRGFSESIC